MLAACVKGVHRHADSMVRVLSSARDRSVWLKFSHYCRRYTAERLAALRHGNGTPVCLLYGAYGLPVPARSAALAPAIAATPGGASAAPSPENPFGQGPRQAGSANSGSGMDRAVAPREACGPGAYPEHPRFQGQVPGQAAREQGGGSASRAAAPDQAHAAAQGSEDPELSRAGHAGGLQAAPGAVGQGPTVTFSVLRGDGSFVGFQCARPPWHRACVTVCS